MHISSSILITTAFVSAMLVLQESSATAQTCKDTWQKQLDACSLAGAPCGPAISYGQYPFGACDQCRGNASVAYTTCVHREQIRAVVIKPGGSTLRSNTSPKGKQPLSGTSTLGGANSNLTNQGSAVSGTGLKTKQDLGTTTKR
jgi:hypothetical protein